MKRTINGKRLKEIQDFYQKIGLGTEAEQKYFSFVDLFKNLDSPTGVVWDQGINLNPKIGVD